MKFKTSILHNLKYYVYLYSHPLTNQIFYVGKGKGNRVFSHLEEIKETDKVKYIADLRANGLEPKIEILIHGLEDEQTALRVESSIIDLIGIRNLKNINSGYESASYGRMTVYQINSLYNKQKVDIDEASILIRINQAFRYSMSERELYDYTRGFWKISLNSAKKVKYGIAVYQGIIQEVYEISEWHIAGSTENIRSLEIDDLKRVSNRLEFTGEIAQDSIREKYRFKSVEHYFKQGNSNPIMYVNIK